VAVAPLSLLPSSRAPPTCSACQVTAAAIAPARISRLVTGRAVSTWNATMNSATFNATARLVASTRTGTPKLAP
jgi:hypothetical protein